MKAILLKQPKGLLHLLFAALILAQACTRSDDDLGNAIPITSSTVLVLNEGLFRRANASITGYEPETEMTVGSVYDPSNTASGGIDILQSATAIGDTLILVANNSNALVILEATSLTEIDRIPALGSPRYLARMSNGQLLVTDLSANKLLELNPDFSTARIVAHQGQAEGIIAYNNGALFVSPSKRSIYFYDADLGSVTDSLALSFRVNAILSLGGSRIAVCGGVLEAGESGGLTVLDWEDKTVEYTLGFSESESSLYPRIALSSSHLFCLQRNLFSIPLDSLDGVGDFRVLVPTLADAYGLGVDPVNDEVYVADARNGLSRGQVLRFNPEGFPVDTFEAGIFPNGFVFR